MIDDVKAEYVKWIRKMYVDDILKPIIPNHSSQLPKKLEKIHSTPMQVFLYNIENLTPIDFSVVNVLFKTFLHCFRRRSPGKRTVNYHPSFSQRKKATVTKSEPAQSAMTLHSTTMNVQYFTKSAFSKTMFNAETYK